MLDLVLDTENLCDLSPGALIPFLRELRTQTVRPDTLIVTHSAPVDLDAATIAWGGPLRAVRTPGDYYEAKNFGYTASTADVVAFLDVDCTPAEDWLARIAAPFVDPAVQAVAGQTRYTAGFGARFTDRIDFSLVPASRGVRNFYANNVAFRRGAFTGYRALPGNDRGACVVAAVEARRRGVVIHPADARVAHRYPESAGAWLHKRWLRVTDVPAVLRAIAAIPA